MNSLSDTHGRSFPSLRLSLTEAGNCCCSDCRPHGQQIDGRPRFLDTEEIRRLVRAFAALGMHKIAQQRRLKAAGHNLQQGQTGFIRHFASIGG